MFFIDEIPLCMRVAIILVIIEILVTPIIGERGLSFDRVVWPTASSWNPFHP